MLVLLILCVDPDPVQAAELKDAENIATFSVVAYDPATGEVGVAVQSKFFAVGAVVPYAKAGVGAVASQALGNPTFGPRGLELLAAGADPQEVIEILTRNDDNPACRQIGVVSAQGDGDSATYSGAECMAWGGGRVEYTPEGIVFACQGNILAGPQVVDAMAEAMLAGGMSVEAELTAAQERALEHDDLAGRMLAALISGQAVGGDSRGMQSAALLVCQEGMGYGGYTDVKYDLRVDDALDPFDELARLLNLARPFSLVTEGYNYAYAGDFEQAFDTFEYLIDLDPENKTHHYHYACALCLSGNNDGALFHLEIALEFMPELKAQAPEDPDLTALRELDVFKDLVWVEEKVE